MDAVCLIEVKSALRILATHGRNFMVEVSTDKE
jgi:hypothetical protein